MFIKYLKEHKINFLLITLVMILAFSLRIYNIENIGLYHMNEGDHLIGGACLLKSDFEYCDMERGSFFTSRPFYGILTAVSLSIFGLHDWSGILISVVLGTLTILVTFFIGKELYDYKIGLIAAFFLSIMNYHIIFSRMALAEINSSFFLSLTILFYILSKKRKTNKYLFLTGIFSGITFGVRYSEGALAVILIILMEILYSILSKKEESLISNIKTSSKNILLFISGLFIILLFISGLYLIQGMPPFPLFLNYVNLLIPNIIHKIPFVNENPTIMIDSESFGRRNTDISGVFRSLIIYSFYLYRLVPVLLWLFVFSGFVFFMTMRDNKSLIPIIWFLFIFLLFVVYGHNSDRHIVPLLPAIALIGSRGLNLVCSNIKHILLIVFIIFVTALFATFPYLSMTFHAHAESGKFLEENNATGGFSTNYPLIGWYSMKTNVKILNISNLNENIILSENISHILIDSLILDSLSKDNFLLKIYERCEPIKIIQKEQEKWRFLTPDDWEYNFSLFILNKINVNLAADLKERLDFHAQTDYIRIYSAKDVKNCLYS